MEKALPRHAQTGHTVYKIELSGLFTAISLRFCTYPRKTASEAEFWHSQLGLLSILRRVEITDDRTKRRTMGGSVEPPFLLP